MSFTSEVKAEIGQVELKPCCVKAQLAALLQVDATLTIVNQQFKLHFKTENPTTAKRFWVLLKQRYHINPELSVTKQTKLKKNHVVSVMVNDQVKEILTDLQLWDAKGLHDIVNRQVVSKECCARAYLAGAFLASGSINSPTKSNYHLEIALHNQELASFTSKLMHRFDLPAKIISRRNQFVVYVKASEKIADFLKAVAAVQALMKFEDIRIQRDFKNSLTRLDNCEVANEVKTMKAALKQLEDIEYLQLVGRFELLELKLKEVATLRQQYPEASFNELSEIYQKQTGIAMSKSGMKHRFNKIASIADKIRESSAKKHIKV